VFHAALLACGRELRRRPEVRVIDCNECGDTIKAANDEELARVMTRHMQSEHADVEWDEDAAGELVSAQAYDATDS
jgi:predicted small metal-binding protein